MQASKRGFQVIGQMASRSHGVPHACNLTSPIKWPGHFNPVLRLLSTRAPLPCDGNKDQVRLMSASWWFWICPIDWYNVMIFMVFFRIPNKIDFQKMGYFRNVGPPSGRPHSWAGTTGLKRWQRPGTLDLFFSDEGWYRHLAFVWMDVFFPMKIWWRFSSRKMGLMNGHLASVSRTGIESAQCGYRWNCFLDCFSQFLKHSMF